jgi:CHASE3 domain sensor protein
MSKLIRDQAMYKAALGKAGGASASRFSLKKIALLAGAALLAALVVMPSFWAFRQIDASAKARKHTYEIILKAEALLSAMTEAETGQRGYALTGNETYLEPYTAVRESLTVQLEALRQVSLIEAARKHLETLAPLMTAKLAEMSRVIALRRNHDLPSVQAVVGSGEG